MLQCRVMLRTRERVMDCEGKKDISFPNSSFSYLDVRRDGTNAAFCTYFFLEN